MKFFSSVLILGMAYSASFGSSLSGYYNLSNPREDSDGTKYVEEIQFLDNNCMLRTSVADSTSTRDGYLFNFMYTVKPYKKEGNEILVKTKQYSSKEGKLVNGEIVYKIDSDTIYFSKDFSGKAYNKDKTSVYKHSKKNQFKEVLSKWKESFLDKKDPMVEYEKGLKDAREMDCRFSK